MTLVIDFNRKGVNMRLTNALLLSTALGLSSTGLAETDSMMAAAGEKVFEQQCTACHSKSSSQNTFGPSLVGVVGREAGTLPRFAYSDALKESGITWDEDNLRKWIASNDDFIPGTRMRHVEINDKANQDYLLAFLKNLSE